MSKSILPVSLRLVVQPSDLQSTNVVDDIERLLQQRFPHPHYVVVNEGRVHLRKGEDVAVYAPAGKRGGMFDMFALEAGRPVFLKLARVQ